MSSPPRLARPPRIHTRNPDMRALPAALSANVDQTIGGQNAAAVLAHAVHTTAAAWRAEGKIAAAILVLAVHANTILQKVEERNVAGHLHTALGTRAGPGPGLVLHLPGTTALPPHVISHVQRVVRDVPHPGGEMRNGPPQEGATSGDHHQGEMRTGGHRR